MEQDILNFISRNPYNNFCTPGFSAKTDIPEEVGGHCGSVAEKFAEQILAAGHFEEAAYLRTKVSSHEKAEEALHVSPTFRDSEGDWHYLDPSLMQLRSVNVSAAIRDGITELPHALPVIYGQTSRVQVIPWPHGDGFSVQKLLFDGRMFNALNHRGNDLSYHFHLPSRKAEVSRSWHSDITFAMHMRVVLRTIDEVGMERRIIWHILDQHPQMLLLGGEFDHTTIKEDEDFEQFADEFTAVANQLEISVDRLRAILKKVKAHQLRCMLLSR